MDNHNKKPDLADITLLCPRDKRRPRIPLSVIKNAYICEDVTVETLARRYGLSPTQIKKHLEGEGWENLRKDFLQKGLVTLRKERIMQLEDLMDLEQDVMLMRTVQLRQRVQYLVKYFYAHGDLFKRDPRTDDLLLDDDNQPIPMDLPLDTREIGNIKELLNTSEGMRKLIQILRAEGLTDELPEEVVNSKDTDTIDISDYKHIFEKKKK